MRYLKAICFVSFLLLTSGCQKEQPQSVHVRFPDSPLRPMDTLRPLEPPTSQPSEPARPDPVPSVTEIAPQPTTKSVTKADEAPIARSTSHRPNLASKHATTPAPPLTRTYTVKLTDTLWSIAKKHLGDGRRWEEILEMNPGLEPIKLIPGQKIMIPVK